MADHNLPTCILHLQMDAHQEKTRPKRY